MKGNFLINNPKNGCNRQSDYTHSFLLKMCPICPQTSQKMCPKCPYPLKPLKVIILIPKNVPYLSPKKYKQHIFSYLQNKKNVPYLSPKCALSVPKHPKMCPICPQIFKNVPYLSPDIPKNMPYLSPKTQILPKCALSVPEHPKMCPKCPPNVP